jgi:small-conductance mechanosensitive channel
METGQWVDGDLYNGRIVLIANSYVLRSRYFNCSDFHFFLWDDKIPIQYGSDYEKAKEIILKRRVDVRLNCEVQTKWTSLQNKLRLEDAQTEPMISLIADNWAEYTLRYVVGYKKKIYKIRIVYKNLN